jgi:hypothetical protein
VVIIWMMMRGGSSAPNTGRLQPTDRGVPAGAHLVVSASGHLVALKT